MSDQSLPSNISKFLERVESIVDMMLSHEGKVRVVSHYDGDGICAAAIMTKALMENGIPFHTTMIRGLTKNEVRAIASEKNRMVVFLDLGSGQIELLEQLDCAVIVCDHHQPLRESKSIVQLNPHFFDIDGSYGACGSTLAFLIAERMVEDTNGLFGVALAGILADRQHLGGFSGLNKGLLERYMETGAVKVDRALQLEGENVLEAITGSLEPFFKGMSGRDDRVRSFLSRIGLDPVSRLDDLHQEQYMALSSMLVVHLLRQGTRPETCEDFIIDKYWLDRFGLHARQLAAVVNACGRRGEEDTGLSICLGSKEALERGQVLRQEHRGAIRKAMLELEENGPTRKRNIQYFYSDDHARAGALAGLGMNYLLDQDRPTFALSKDEKVVKVSSRGTRWLVSKGLNLADACRIAAEKVDGVGGGHPIAAGATIPIRAEARFIKELDSLIGDQLKGLRMERKEKT